MANDYFPHLKNVRVSVIRAWKTGSNSNTVANDRQAISNNDTQNQQNPQYFAQFPQLDSDKNTRPNKVAPERHDTSAAKHALSANDNSNHTDQVDEANNEGKVDVKSESSLEHSESDNDGYDACDSSNSEKSDDADDSGYSDAEYEARIPRNSQATILKLRKYKDYYNREIPGDTLRLNDAPANGNPSWWKNRSWCQGRTHHLK